MLKVDDNTIQDALNIAHGIYAPLTGFLRENDFYSVLNNMRLVNGMAWSIPIVLDINEQDYQRIKNKNQIVLIDDDGKLRAIIDNIEIYDYSKEEYAEKVFGTTDSQHPGIAEVMRKGKYLVGGDVLYIKNDKRVFPEFHYTPGETRKIFQNKGWKTIVAFQTRNVPHRSHEHLQKLALQNVDGLFIQPVIGKKKPGDFKDKVILEAYKVLLDKYYPSGRFHLGILPIKMNYAGPREAIFHALIRKNFGCTHMIIGRDHAGVGNYYDSYAAQKIFNQFSEEEIGIKILKYENISFCKECNKLTTPQECMHSKEHKVYVSGTKMREMIKNKEQLPPEFMRPEISELLLNHLNPFIEQENINKQRSWVLWLTGLSASGKTTIAKLLQEELNNQGFKIHHLDGDEVRAASKEKLGFSKEDRDKNINLAIGLSKKYQSQGYIVIASFISPYKHHREWGRQKLDNFVEIFVNTPLEVCEQRDPEGLYKKARAGEIEFFTGISDPYEAPTNPDIELKTDQLSPDQCVHEILNYLKKKTLI